MTHFRWCVPMLLLALSVATLSHAMTNPFQGRWMDESGRLRLEFFSDQTVKIDVSNSDFAGTWKMLEDGRLKIDYTYELTAHIVTGSLDRDQLYIVFMNNAFILKKDSRAPEATRADAVKQSAHVQAARLRASCANNLKQLGLGMKMFSNESRGAKLPPLDSRRGVFMMEPSTFHPEYMPNTKVFVCPTQDQHASHDTISHDSYWYLGYTLPDEETGMAFLKAYQSMAKGEARGQDIRLNESLSSGHEVIFALREGVERFLITDINDPRQSSGLQSRIPIMIEKPGNHEEGSNVLYLDGHVEFVPYPGKYPMTNEFIEGLRAIDASAH